MGLYLLFGWLAYDSLQHPRADFSPPFLSDDSFYGSLRFEDPETQEKQNIFVEE